MTGTGGANLWAGLGKVAFETQDGGARFEFSAQRMIDDEIRNGRANFGPPTGWLQRYDTERTIVLSTMPPTSGGRGGCGTVGQHRVLGDCRRRGQYL